MDSCHRHRASALMAFPWPPARVQRRAFNGDRLSWSRCVRRKEMEQRQKARRKLVDEKNECKNEGKKKHRLWLPSCLHRLKKDSKVAEECVFICACEHGYAPGERKIGRSSKPASDKYDLSRHSFLPSRILSLDAPLTVFPDALSVISLSQHRRLSALHFLLSRLLCLTLSLPTAGNPLLAFKSVVSTLSFLLFPRALSFSTLS